MPGTPDTAPALAAIFARAFIAARRIEGLPPAPPPFEAEGPVAEAVVRATLAASQNDAGDRAYEAHAEATDADPTLYDEEDEGVQDAWHFAALATRSVDGHSAGEIEDMRQVLRDCTPSANSEAVRLIKETNDDLDWDDAVGIWRKERIAALDAADEVAHAA